LPALREGVAARVRWEAGGGKFQAAALADHRIEPS
jgi:hypothetical protein